MKIWLMSCDCPDETPLLNKPQGKSLHGGVLLDRICDDCGKQFFARQVKK